MEIISIIVAFGGGIFGALIGGVAAFIFTGLMALIGIAILMSGGGDVFINTVAFGPFFGPHVAFVGGVAGAAFLGRKKRLALDAGGAINEDKYVDGPDIMTPIFKTVDPMALIVAGIFGVIGFALNYLIGQVWGIKIDTVALTVLICNIVIRFVIGKSGLFGKIKESEKRYDITLKDMVFHGIWALGLAAVISYVTIQTGINSIGFAMSAFSLIFLYMGLNFPTSHHVTMVAGYAAAAFGNIWLGALFGLLACVFGELEVRTTNKNVDTHIDMPAATIALFSFIILTVLV